MMLTMTRNMARIQDRHGRVKGEWDQGCTCFGDNGPRNIGEFEKKADIGILQVIHSKLNAFCQSPHITVSLSRNTALILLTKLHVGDLVWCTLWCWSTVHNRSTMLAKRMNIVKGPALYNSNAPAP